MSGVQVSDQGEGRAEGAGESATARLDRMISHAIDIICDPARPLESLPQELARLAPEAPALELCLALASAADAVQAVFGGGGDSAQRAQRVWQQAAMVGVEVHYLAVTGKAHATAADLIRHTPREESE